MAYYRNNTMYTNVPVIALDMAGTIDPELLKALDHQDNNAIDELIDMGFSVEFDSVKDAALGIIEYANGYKNNKFKDAFRGALDIDNLTSENWETVARNVFNSARGTENRDDRAPEKDNRYTAYGITWVMADPEDRKNYASSEIKARRENAKEIKNWYSSIVKAYKDAYRDVWSDKEYTPNGESYKNHFATYEDSFFDVKTNRSQKRREAAKNAKDIFKVCKPIGKHFIPNVLTRSLDAFDFDDPNEFKSYVRKCLESILSFIEKLISWGDTSIYTKRFKSILEATLEN